MDHSKGIQDVEGGQGMQGVGIKRWQGSRRAGIEWSFREGRLLHSPDPPRERVTRVGRAAMHTAGFWYATPEPDVKTRLHLRHPQ